MMYKKVLLRFDVNIYNKHVQEAMDSSLRARFKERRHLLHQYYMSIPNGEDKREHCQVGVRQEEWESLCKHFESEKFKKDEETGKEPDCVTFYCNMRWNDSKGWICSEAEELYDKMVGISSHPVEEGEAELTDAQVAEKVLGKKSGYVRGLGHGEVPPSSKARIAYNEDEVNQLRVRAEEQERRAEEQERRAAEQEMSCVLGRWQTKKARRYGADPECP